MSMATFNTGGTGSGYMYFTTSTSTATTTTTNVPYEEVMIPAAQPYRVAKRERLSARMLTEMEVKQSIAHQHLNVIEFSEHRVARGLRHYEVGPNTLLELPDGTLIDVEDEYRWRIYEENAKVTREACRIVAFNRFLNASELLEAFIRDAAPHGIRQDQILKVPVEAFINWLIHKAAEADGDVLPGRKWNHRCGYCKKFISKRLVSQGVNFCNAGHLDRYLQRIEMPLLEAPA